MSSMFARGLDDPASGVKWSALQAALLTVGERELGFLSRSGSDRRKGESSRSGSCYRPRLPLNTSLIMLNITGARLFD